MKGVYKLKSDPVDFRDYIYRLISITNPKELPDLVDLRSTVAQVDQEELGSCKANAIDSGLVSIFFYRQNKLGCIWIKYKVWQPKTAELNCQNKYKKTLVNKPIIHDRIVAKTKRIGGERMLKVPQQQYIRLMCEIEGCTISEIAIRTNTNWRTAKKCEAEGRSFCFIHEVQCFNYHRCGNWLIKETKQGVRPFAPIR